MHARPIIVLGSERSGTSMTAEMIQRWGAYLGEPEELGAPDERNAHGRFEYRPLWDLLAEIGDFASGLSWWESSFDAHVRSKVDDRDIARAARALVSRMQSGGRPWAWKDPALAHFLTFWSHFWNDPVFVITVRSPVDIAVSWQAFIAAEGERPSSMECNLARWQHMSLCILRGTESANAKLFVEYEQVVTSPLEQARRLANFLDGQCDVETTTGTVAAMANACDTTLWRNRNASYEAGDAMTEPQRALYGLQRSKVTDANIPFVDDLPMPAGWRDLVITSERRG